MPTRSRQYGVVAILALTAGLAACSSSTAPNQITPAQLAKDLDAVYAADLAAGTQGDTQAAGIIAQFIEVGPAFGGGEATFTVTTASGNQTWHGVGFGEAIGADTQYIAAIYPNRNLQQAMFIGLVVSNGAHVDSIAGASVTGLVTGVDDSTMTLSASLISTGGTACSLQTGLAIDTLYASILSSGVTCAPAKFQLGFNIVYPVFNLGALQTVSGTATFTGPFFTQSGASRVVGIPSKGAALFDRAWVRLHH